MFSPNINSDNRMQSIRNAEKYSDFKLRLPHTVALSTLKKGNNKQEHAQQQNKV